MKVLFPFIALMLFIVAVHAAEEEALSDLIARAEGGEAEAQFLLGIKYEKGDGVTLNLIEAFRWYQEAAEAGYAAAQNNLAWMYANGKFVARNYDEALKWYREAAGQGDVRGQTTLGWMYAKGHGVVQDYREAFKWYSLAAEQGFAEAQAYPWADVFQGLWGRTGLSCSALVVSEGCGSGTRSVANEHRSIL